MKVFSGLKNQSVYLAALMVLCLFCFCSSARAGESGAADMAESDSPSESTVKEEKAVQTDVGTITVTARKKEEDVQKVPMSISVFSSQMIEESGIYRSSELLRYSPNVYVRDAGSNHQTIIRGITGFENALHSSTGYYIDDVNIPLVYMQNPELLEVERVEVLKGPQGSLYGRNSESGVINIITRQPDNETRGKVFSEYAFYDTEHGSAPAYQAGATLSTPVVEDKFYIGLAGKYRDSDGYIKNKYDNDDEANDIQRFNGHAKLRWTPSDAWDASLLMDAMDSEDGFVYGRLENIDNRHFVNWDANHFREQNSNTQALRIKHRGSKVDFLSVTGRNFFDDETAGDFDMSPADLYPSLQKEEVTLYSQEFRVSSSADGQGPFSWLMGTYFFKEDLEAFQRVTETRLTDIDMKGAAAFGQVTYTFMDRLHFTAGARYDYQEMEGTQSYTNTFGATSVFSAGEDKGEFLPRISVAYDLTPAATIYGTVSKGYMAGGYNFPMATNSETLMYGPEYTWNYEAGVKSSWLNNRLIANLAVFYIDMTDKQVSEVSPIHLTAAVSNAAEARSMGVELEIQARPARGWQIYGGIGYTDAEVEEWTATEYDSLFNLVEYDYSGKELPNAPSVTYNIGTQYMHDTGIYGRADILGTGDFYHDSKNTLKESAYEIVNLRLGYMMERFEIALWCKNLFDTDYKTVQFNWAGMTGVFDGSPRQVGATVTYRF